jgi:hypothetical protein
MSRALFLFAVLTSSSLAHGQSPYTQPGVFKYTGPVGYKRNDSRVPKGRIGFFADPKEGYSSNVMLTIADSGAYTAAKLGKETVDYLKANDKTAKTLGSKVIKVGGKEGYSIVMDRTLPNGMLIGQQQVIAVNKGKVLIFTFSALKKTYAPSNVKFESSLKSFSWLN